MELLPFMVLLGEERVINNIALFFSVNAIALAVLRLVVVSLLIGQS